MINEISEKDCGSMLSWKKGTEIVSGRFRSQRIGCASSEIKKSSAEFPEIPPPNTRVFRPFNDSGNFIFKPLNSD